MQILADSFEAAFRVPDERALLVDAGDGGEAIGDYLAHAVARNPGDLRSHVQRVYLHLRGDDRQALSGALLDLYIGLGEKGRPLRARLLKECSAKIEDTLCEFLQAHIEQGIGRFEATPEIADAMLARGVSSGRVVIQASGSAAEVRRDYLAEAESHIECGQLDLARETLEEGIVIDPRQRRLHLNLLEVYRYTGNRSAFRDMKKRLQELQNPFSDLWMEELVFVGSEAGVD